MCSSEKAIPEFISTSSGKNKSKIADEVRVNYNNKVLLLYALLFKSMICLNVFEKKSF